MKKREFSALNFYFRVLYCCKCSVVTLLLSLFYIIGMFRKKKHSIYSWGNNYLKGVLLSQLLMTGL